MTWLLIGIVFFFLVWALIEGDDPKFGYHYLWIVPIGLIISIFLFLIEGIYRSANWLNQWWYHYRNPKIKELEKFMEKRK